MTSEDSKRLDDAEFGAFLQGHGELARQLQGLPQPSPSAALDAAILAQAEALLKTETPLQQAANDALSGRPGKPAKPRFLMRWSTQLGMAACMVLAVLATLRWQTEPVTQSYDAAPPVEPAPPPPAPVPAAAPAPSEKSVEPVEKKAQAKPELVRPKAIARSAPPVAKAAAEAKEPAQAQDTQAAPAPTPAPAPFASRENYAVSPPQLASPEHVPSRARAIVVPQAPAAANPPSAIAEPAAMYSPAPVPIVPPPVYSLVPAPAPVVASGATATAAPTESASAPIATLQGKPESPARAEAWLSAIDEMLKAGLRQDALEEWEKFKRAYPNYPVPEKLRAQIRLLQK